MHKILMPGGSQEQYVWMRFYSFYREFTDKSVPRFTAIHMATELIGVLHNLRPVPLKWDRCGWEVMDRA